MGFGKDGKGQIIRESRTITLGTLADDAAIKASTQIGLEEDFRIIKTEVFLGITGHTDTEVPVLIGIADNELTVAEIAECMNVNGPGSRNDNVNNERVMRPVFEMCQLMGDSKDVLNNGLPITKTLRWTFSDTEGWTWFAINKSGSALTTGTVIEIVAKHFGVWVT